MVLQARVSGLRASERGYSQGHGEFVTYAGVEQAKQRVQKMKPGFLYQRRKVQIWRPRDSNKCYNPPGSYSYLCVLIVLGSFDCQIATT